MQAKERKSIKLEDVVPQDREKLNFLNCLICHSILDLAYTDLCGHIFCRDCGLPVYQSEKKCPVTMAELEVEPSPVHYLDNIINQAVIYCTNRQQLCTWEGVKCKLDDHLNTDCPKELITCPHDRCGIRIYREVLAYHKENCELRKVNCIYCEDSVALIDLSTHHQLCANYPCICQCNQIIQRKQLNLHIINDCPKTILPCCFSHLGCEAKVERSQLNEHLNANLGNHLLFMMDSKKTKEKKPNIENLFKEQRDEFSSEIRELRESINLLKEGGEFIGKKRPREGQEDDAAASDLEVKLQGKNVHIYTTNKEEEKFSINGKTVKYLADGQYSYIFHKFKKTAKYNEWTITLNTDSHWMAFGLCQRDLLVSNKLESDNLSQGYFVTTGGQTYNCLVEEENKVAIPDFIELKKGNTIQFRYRFEDSCLYFKTSKGNTAKLSKVPYKSTIVPCVILYFKNDEITLEY
jgi:hypothetical protein